METETTILFRPVGQAELDLIRDSGWRAFPPRLPHQPIFYPVANQVYAEQIASRWNATEAEAGYVGYVTRFAIITTWLSRYPLRIVGGREHAEYWIPAEDLSALNANIVGAIEVVSEHRDGSALPAR